MSDLDDIRKAIQDLVAPDLKSLAADIAAARTESRLRDEALAREAKAREELILAKLEVQDAKLEAHNGKLEAQDARLEAISAKMDYQYNSLMNALNLDKRVEALEPERHPASA